MASISIPGRGQGTSYTLVKAERVVQDSTSGTLGFDLVFRDKLTGNLVTIALDMNETDRIINWQHYGRTP